MQLPSATLWSLLLAGAHAELRVIRRDSGMCSMEIVATVTKTYTVTGTEEIVVPCSTGVHGPGSINTADAPSASTTSASSPESPDSPPSNPGKGEGKENIDSKLPFDSLIPSDYFPDVTFKEPTAAITSIAPPASTSLAGLPSDDDAPSTTITTAIKPVNPSGPESPVTPSPEETNASVPTVPEESQPSEPSAPAETEGSEPEQGEDNDEDDEEDTDDEDDNASEPTNPDDSDDEDVSEPEPEPSDDEPTTPAEPTPTATLPADEEPVEEPSTTEATVSSTQAAEEEPEVTTSVETSTSAQAPEPTFTRNYPADAVDKLQDESMEKLKEHLKRNGSPGCTLENAAVRREWGDLSVAERQEYVAAVKCLQNKPAKTPSNVAAGAKSRFDDFVVTHIQQTNSIHNTANFLGWHRAFTWAYETALRDECGYTGYQPYWNWDRYANDPVNSPIFDGGKGSLGGNSNGNGCAAPGPFGELKINLGPGNNLNYNPRCLKRDVSRRFSMQCTADKTMAVLNEGDIGRFQDHMQFSGGIHAGGHFTVGGDPGGDVFTSPGDPVFYLHHAMIDRVWWIWQLQDLNTRLSAVAGRVGNSNRQGSLLDQVSLGFAAGTSVLGELMDTMGGKKGEFCYIYV